MAYAIRYSAEALNQLREIRAFDRASILDKIERLLTIAPERESKTQSSY